MISIKVDKSKKYNKGDWSLYVSFQYRQHIVDTIKKLPVRYWDNDNKEWEIPLNKLDTLVTEFNMYEIEITGTYVDLTKTKCEIPDGFNFKTKPFQHQVEAFEYGLNHDTWFLGDEQGLGKSKQAIDIAVGKKLQHGYKHCLIICCVNGLKWNWLNEVSIHSNESAYILGQRQLKNGKLKIGGSQEKLEDLHTLDKIDDYFIITNIESLRNENIQEIVSKHCNDGTIGMTIVDEIHRCKDVSSQQGKGLLKVNSKNKLAMTGTPLMNSPLDLFIILKWLGYEPHSFYAFKKHYCHLGGYGGHQVIGYKNLEELQDGLNDIMVRRKKEDVLDLPDKLYIDEYVEMSKDQQKIYNEVTKELKDNIDQIKCSNNPLAQLIRLRQATGYTGILSSTIQVSSKLDRMEELVQECTDNGKKVVIFSNWTQMTDAICERLGNYRYGLITGQTKDEDRQDIVNKFQNSDSLNVLIGTLGAMGTGLTLTAGTVEIFMDEPWTMATKEQAEDRCHRVGTKSNVTIYTLMCKDTIDERIHSIIKSKGDIASLVVDNVDKGEIVDYLLN